MTNKNPNIAEGIEGEFVGHGLVFGKFMPPTNGHLYLINFARLSCRKLTIMVCSLPTEPIPGEQRYKWIKELFPDCNVVHHYIDIPQEPKGPDDRVFFETWRNSIYKHCPGEKFDALFASEPYGYRMADVMDIRFIPVDVKRELVSISGTAMRQNPLLHWKYLHPVVRPYFLKRVAVVGPEATGKSTLARNLATHFDTVCVAEYARNMYDDFSANMPEYDLTKSTIKDMSTIARGQIAGEDSLARQANRVIFCDTELISVAYWSDFYFKECPGWITKAAEEKKYDLYLLLDPRGVESFYTDIPEHSMPKPEDRVDLFYWWQAELTRRKLPFVIIAGNDWETRTQKAISVVNESILLESSSPQPTARAARA